MSSLKLPPPYHLRTNKMIERQLFVELLHLLDNRLPAKIGEHIYVGLGGPYLEDFNLIHAIFESSRMISLEIDESVITRQRINRPHSAVTLTSQSTTDFSETFEFGEKPLIVWFDYTKPEWEKQISECCKLLQRLPAMSVLKVTLSGGIEKPKALAKLSRAFAISGPFSERDVYRDNICGTLYSVLRRAIAISIPDSEELCVRSLASYYYDEGTPILTVTMIVGPLDDIESLLSEPHLASWRFADINWRGPKQINVPNFGIRERLAVDQLLPALSAEEILDHLQLRLALTPAESAKQMENYLEFYRQVPQFARISL